MTMPRVLIHAERDRCGLPDCEWSGFHFHWRHRQYRSAFDGSMTPDELSEFDADCAADHADRVRSEP
jgi:hypothetical protein